jgi:hypothetical protein
MATNAMRNRLGVSPDVLRVGDRLKMLGIHARRCSTKMVEFKAGGDWADELLIHPSVRGHPSSMLGLDPAVATLTKAAAHLHPLAHPQPAPI